jgi:DNA-binding transcriptional ArsR family regulator
MEHIKETRYTRQQVSLAQLTKALGHPARIAILQHLISVKTCVCGDIVEEVGLAQATISQHLKELKQSGLIKGNVTGRNVCYCIDDKTWQESHELLNLLFSQYTPKNDSCC